MSWWDYGYQIAGMANRTTLVDNNTWNNSHIALVRAAGPVTLLTTFNLFYDSWCNQNNLCMIGHSADFTQKDPFYSKSDLDYYSACENDV